MQTTHRPEIGPSAAETDVSDDSGDEYMGEEMMIDYMFNNFDYGVGLRAIEITGEYQAATPNTSVWAGIFEPHAESNDLISKVELYLSMNNGTKYLHQTWSLSDMYEGDFGLPRFDVSVPGLKPGINPPLLLRSSAILLVGTVIAV